MKIITPLILSALAGAVAALAQSPATGPWNKGHGATLAPLPKAPTLDGVIEPGEWDLAVRTVNFQSIFKQMMDPRTGATMIGFHGDRLYIAVVSELPPRPVQGPFSTATTRDAELISDANAVEIWFDPNRDRRESGAGDQAFYQLFVNTLGTTEDARIVPGRAPDKGWNPDVQSAHAFDTKARRWTAEISIALKDLGLDPAQLTGASIGVLVSRNYKFPWAQVTAFPHHDAFVSWRYYPRFVFTADDPVVAIQSLGDKLFQAQPDFQIAIRNPGPARTARVKLHIKSSDMPDLKDEKELALPAGGSAEYRFTVPPERLHVHEVDHSVTIRVEEAGTGRPWFDYAAGWSHDPVTTIGWTTARRSVEKKWDIRTTALPEESLAFSVYPSYRRFRVSLNAANMVADPDEADADKVSDSAEVTIQDAAGQTLTRATLSWDRAKKQTGKTELLEVPALPAGEYTVTAVFNKQPQQPISKKYTRQTFAFEGNTIGLTDKIYPPFEPVVAAGDKVKVVGREYTVGALGLWSSVKSLDRELLAGPIVLKADGSRVLAGAAKLVGQSPTGAIYHATATDDAVTVTSTCVTEIDGCMKVTLTLAPGAKAAELKSLALEIPLRDAMAPLWHVATTGLRVNPVGAAPAGTGVVWDSNKFPDGNWIGNFKPYLWLGGSDRGLAWFANNDKGWVLDWNEKKVFAPCQEMIRRDGVLTLKVNLVQKPVTLTEPRTIVFGLMASPGKPMPADWRRTRFASGIAKEHQGRVQNINFMGSQYWGSEEVFCAAYPRHADLGILEAISRLPGAPTVQEWLDRNFQPEMPVRGKSKDVMARLANISYNAGSGGRYFTAYWDEYHGDSHLHPERQVFNGEWSGNVMTRSRQDFRAYWGAEFVKRNFGLYFDNVWPRRTTDTLTSDAYVIPGLGVQSSALIWEQRDYHRRIWNIHKEFGAPFNGRPIQMIHMTNAGILPYLTWTDATLDLEWFYGPEPQQSKYAHGMLRAQSAGRQWGVYPCVLARIEGVTSPAQGRLATRSRFGAMMVHEILAENENAGLVAHLYNHGYGTPDCVVHNYWDENYPVTVSDPEVKTLLLKNGTDLLLLLCSWRNEPVTVTCRFDTAALGVRPATAADIEDQVGATKSAVAAAEKKLADTTAAVAAARQAVADGKPDAQKKLDAALKAEPAAAKALQDQQALLPIVEAAARPISYDAKTAQLTVPLEGYGVRMINLRMTP